MRTILKLCLLTVLGGGLMAAWPFAHVGEGLSDLPEIASITDPSVTPYAVTALPPRILTPTTPPNPEPGQSRPAALPKSPAATKPSAILSQKDYPEHPYWLLDTPADPLYPQWYHGKIEAANSWDIAGTETIVAVIDSGFALAHEDLSSVWATNPDEQGITSSGDRCWTGTPANKQTNNCDDDNNGFIDDWRGWDFYHEDNSPQAGQGGTGPAAAHGTAVAGFIGAAWNTKGVAGINPLVKILPLQGLGDNGSGSTYDIVRAIEYAADRGADVINLSLGGNAHDEAMEAAITYATGRGIPVVAAAGNCATDPERNECEGLSAPGYMTYPALYDTVIAVGATTSNDTRASFSSYGPKLDLVAPGSSLPYSTSWSAANQSTLYSSNLSGTSFSAPLVSGVVAAMRAQDQMLTVRQIQDLLTEAADSVAGMLGQNRTDEYGTGRLNAYKALMLARAKSSALATLSNTLPGRTSAPTLAAGFGTDNDRPVAAGERLYLLCLTMPGSLCRIELTQRGSGSKVIVGDSKTTETGFAEWSTSLTAGTWDAVAHSASAASPVTTILVE